MPSPDIENSTSKLKHKLKLNLSKSRAFIDETSATALNGAHVSQTIKRVDINDFN